VPVDTNEESVRIRVKDPSEFDEGTFRTISISEEQGIKAVIGKYKADPAGSTHVQSYIFEKSKWSAAEADKWVKEHKRASSIDGRQTRVIEPEESEMRFEFDKVDGPKIYGYAAVFNSKTPLYSGFYEQVAPGAFSESLRNHNIYALWQHDWSMPLGDIKSGTLRVWEDDKGLAYALNPGDTDYAVNLVKNVKRGVVRQSSFGFDILKCSNTRDQDTNAITRTIQNVRLYDVSPVTLGAYPQTEGLNVRDVRMAKDGQRTVYLDGDEVIEPPTVEDSSNVPSAKEINEMVENLKKRFK
jgi:hypothetical protein